MSIKNIAIKCCAVAGVAILINVPIGVFLFSSFMDRMVFYTTSVLHIYGDEAIGDFLVSIAFFLSLLVAVLVVLIATRLVEWFKRRLSNVK
jgi:small-conductance mechanosensitive channel